MSNRDSQTLEVPSQSHNNSMLQIKLHSMGGSDDEGVSRENPYEGSTASNYGGLHKSNGGIAHSTASLLPDIRNKQKRSEQMLEALQNRQKRTSLIKSSIASS